MILSDHTLLISSLAFGYIESESSPSIFDLAEAERIRAQKILQYAKGNKAEASCFLNTALARLHIKLKEYDLKCHSHFEKKFSLLNT